MIAAHHGPWSCLTLHLPDQKQCGMKNSAIIVGFSSLHRLYTHRRSAPPSWRHRPFCHDLTLQTTTHTTTTMQPPKSKLFLIAFRPNKAQHYLLLLMCGLPVQLRFQLDRWLTRNNKKSDHCHSETCHHTMLPSL